MGFVELKKAVFGEVDQLSRTVGQTPKSEAMVKPLKRIDQVVEHPQSALASWGMLSPDCPSVT